MPTHHAAHHEHTMNVIVVLVWLWICICINICICICIFLALAERAGRAAAASTQPTLSQIHLCRKHFFSASSFAAINSSFFWFLHLTFQLWWNVLFILCCFLVELSLFNVDYLVLIFAATLKIFSIFFLVPKQQIWWYLNLFFCFPCLTFLDYKQKISLYVNRLVAKV